MTVGIRGSTISSSSGLLPQSLLERIRAMDRKLPGLTEEAYHLDRNQKFGEVTAQAWRRLQAAWTTFRSELATTADFDPATTITRERFLLPLFDVLGYGRLLGARAIELDGKTYAITHGWGDTPIHLVGANVSLDRRTANVRGAAGQSPHGLLQELLNKSDAHLWGLVSNGRELRILRDNSSLTRLAYLEFDLEAMFEGENYADFALLWLVCHQSRLEGSPPEAPLLEQWQQNATTEGARALDRLRDGVEAAITILGRGFLAYPRNHALKDAVRFGQLTDRDYYRELLRLIYRLIFLFVAEDRGALLHPEADQRYYSTAALRRLARERRGTTHPDLWRSLRTVIGSLGSRDGAPALGLPALGGFLFGTTACPNLDASDIANGDLLEAIRALALVREGTVRVSVDYRNLGSEELGSIYESLLAYHPEVHPDAATFELKSAAGNERKTTGSYYTPTSLINELLDGALEPVLDEAVRKKSPYDAEAAILALRVVDPAVGSGHFLVAAGHRIAKRLASVRTGDDEPSPTSQRTALRDIVGRCLFGVDLNPDAAELCRVGLWLEALDPGRPLSFLDAHIRSGNSLLGTTQPLLAAGLPDETFAVLEGDDRDVVVALKRANKAERSGQLGLDEARLVETHRRLALLASEIAKLPEGAVDEVDAKAQRYGGLISSEAYVEAKALADAWCAAFVGTRTGHDTGITSGTLRRLARDPEALSVAQRQAVHGLAETYDFFHWHLEFPEVFAAGGFDCVLGNPPWDMVEFSEKEFFAARAPAIASAASARKRRDLIQALAVTDPGLMLEFSTAKALVARTRHFIQASGRFPLSSVGRVNLYPLFVEAVSALLSSRGRAGLIVPSAVSMDAYNAALFGSLLRSRRLVSFYDFENAGELFPGVHRSYRFCLLVLAGSSGDDQIDFCYFAHSPTELRDPNRRIRLSIDDIETFSPNTLAPPILFSDKDRELAIGAYRRVGVFVDRRPGAINNWGASIQRMLSLSDEGDYIRRFDEVPSTDRENWGRVYSGKAISSFTHRFATFDGQDWRAPDVTERLDPSFSISTEYMAKVAEIDARLGSKWPDRWLVGFRDISRATDERTSIAAIIPRVGCDTHCRNIFLDIRDPRLAACLVANLNSFTFDYFARQKVIGTGIGAGVLEQLPVLPPTAYSAPTPWDEAAGTIRDWVASRVLELSYTAWDLQSFAMECGWTGAPFAWDESRRFELRCELDAVFLLLYLQPELATAAPDMAPTAIDPGVGLDDGSLATVTQHIFNSFPIVRRRDEAGNDGEYATHSRTIEILRGLSSAVSTREPYVSRLDPGPVRLSSAYAPTQAQAPDRTIPTPVAAAVRRRGSRTSTEAPASPTATLFDFTAEAPDSNGFWEAESEVDRHSLQPGRRVRHTAYGEGTVVAVRAGNPSSVAVRFTDFEKTIALGYGKLEFGRRTAT